MGKLRWETKKVGDTLATNVHALGHVKAGFPCRSAAYLANRKRLEWSLSIAVHDRQFALRRLAWCCAWKAVI
jgi:hypothetical protein